MSAPSLDRSSAACTTNTRPLPTPTATVQLREYREGAVTTTTLMLLHAYIEDWPGGPYVTPSRLALGDQYMPWNDTTSAVTSGSCTTSVEPAVVDDARRSVPDVMVGPAYDSRAALTDCPLTVTLTGTRYPPCGAAASVQLMRVLLVSSRSAVHGRPAVVTAMSCGELPKLAPLMAITPSPPVSQNVATAPTKPPQPRTIRRLGGAYDSCSSPELYVADCVATVSDSGMLVPVPAGMTNCITPSLYSVGVSGVAPLLVSV